MPSISGIFQSVTSTSAPRSSRAASAASPLAHVSHSCPARRSAAAITSAMRASSSTMRTRAVMPRPAGAA